MKKDGLPRPVTEQHGGAASMLQGLFAPFFAAKKGKVNHYDHQNN